MSLLRTLQLRAFDAYAGYGAVFIRLLIGHRLVAGTADNVFSHERMLEFAGFLGQNGFPLPLASAYLSAYAQFICGILILLGAFARPAAAVMAINFMVALAMVHLGQPYLENFDALAMLAGSLFLLFHGAGSLSVDDFLARRDASTGVRGSAVARAVASSLAATAGGSEDQGSMMRRRRTAPQGGGAALLVRDQPVLLVLDVQRLRLQP